MQSKEEERLEERLVAETQKLMSMSEEDRTEYVKGVLRSLAEAIRQIMNEKAVVKQGKMAKQFLEELNDKAEVLIPPVIYTIKEEFQPIIIELLKSLEAK